MANKKYFDRQAQGVRALGRSELTRRIRRIRSFSGRFKLDFTEDYLNNISVDRLRHILLAALINAKSNPGDNYSRESNGDRYQPIQK